MVPARCGWPGRVGLGYHPAMQPRQPGQPVPPAATQIQQIVAQVLAEAGPVGNPQQERYLREILTTVVRMMRDDASTGDLKLINTALKELRTAFKVFAPYRHIRKVSAFGWRFGKWNRLPPSSTRNRRSLFAFARSQPGHLSCMARRTVLHAGHSVKA